MSCKFFLVLCAVICIAGSLQAASLRGAAADENTDAVVHKLDYEGVEANMRRARQAYPESGEDSDEEDEEEDAEAQHLNAIRRQQAYEQSVADSQEGSDEDDDDDTEGDDDDDDFYGRRLRRDVSEAVSHNEIEEDSKPSENSEDKEKQPAEVSNSATEQGATAPAATPSGSSNTSVLIMIRDAIKKVTELPNTQQVATSAQQYFQLFEHFLQQTIEQVIGDDDDEDEAESTTIASEAEKETESESASTDKVTEHSTDKTPASETSDKESSAEHVEVPQPEKLTEAANEIKA